MIAPTCEPASAVSETDLVFVLSGGAFNTDPQASLGGPASNQILGNLTNGLFGRVTTVKLSSGAIDHRAFYVFNDHPIGSIGGVTVWAEDEAEHAEMWFGVTVRDAVQQIHFSGSPTGGTFALVHSYMLAGELETEQTGDIPWSADPTTTADAIEQALANIGLNSVEVDGALSDGWRYTLTFTGEEGGRVQLPLAVVSGITGFVTWTVTEQAAGSPINTVAPETGFESVPPVGITFVRAGGEESGIVIGTLRPLDSFPVWLRRVTLADSPEYDRDRFRVVVVGDTDP